MRVVRVSRPRTVPAPPSAEHHGSGSPPEPVVRESALPFVVPCDEEDVLLREQRAYQRGRADGEQAAAAVVSDRLAETRQQADERTMALIEGLAAQLRSFAASIERDAFQFALAVASRIVKKEVELDADTVVRQVREALHRVVGVESIRVRVHPDDEAVIRAARGALLGSVDSIREVAVETDESIDPGGCIIESASGNVDARIATQLRQVESALFGQSERVEERIA